MISVPDPGKKPRQNAAPLDRLISGYERAMLLRAALSCGLFKLLAGKEMSTAQVAAALGWDRLKTGVFLDALAALTLLQKKEKHYCLSPLAQCFLDPKSPYCTQELLELKFTRIAGLSALPHKMCKGAAAASDAVEPSLFTRVMAQSALWQGSIAALARLMARDPAFRRAGSLLDLGCSHGLYSVALCRLNPRLTATVFDRPEVLPYTKQYLAKFALGRRIIFQAGDFYRRPIGGQYDLALASHVFYRPLEQVEPVYRSLARVIVPGGVLYLQHHYLDDSRTAPAQAALFHFTRLVVVPSFYVSTLSETATQLKGAGFILTRVFRSRRGGATVLRAVRKDG